MGGSEEGSWLLRTLLARASYLVVSYSRLLVPQIEAILHSTTFIPCKHRWARMHKAKSAQYTICSIAGPSPPTRHPEKSRDAGCLLRVVVKMLIYVRVTNKYMRIHEASLAARAMRRRMYGNEGIFIF